MNSWQYSYVARGYIAMNPWLYSYKLYTSLFLHLLHLLIFFIHISKVCLKKRPANAVLGSFLGSKLDCFGSERHIFAPNSILYNMACIWICPNHDRDVYFSVFQPQETLGSTMQVFLEALFHCIYDPVMETVLEDTIFFSLAQETKLSANTTCHNTVFPWRKCIRHNSAADKQDFEN